MNSTKRAVVAVVVLLVAAFAVKLRGRPVERTPQQLRSFIKAADAVTPFRVEPEGKWGFFNRHIGGEKVVAQGAQPDAQSQSLLKSCMLSNLSLPLGPLPSCAPRPGVAYRFTKGGETTDVLICFECKMLRFVDESPRKWRNFVVERDAILYQTKPLFQEDAAIQAIPDTIRAVR